MTTQPENLPKTRAAANSRRRVGDITPEELSILSPDQRAIVEAAMSSPKVGYETLAGVTNTPLGTVKSRLSRARSKIMEMRKDKNGGAPD